MAARRHEWNEQITGLFERIAHGNAAQQVQVPDGPGALVMLPTWTWAYSLIDVGRKDRHADGSRLLLPVQVSWDLGSVLVVPEGQSVQVTYTAVGMGHMVSGSAKVSCSPGTAREEIIMADEGLPLPVSVVAPSFPSRRLRTKREELAADGQLSYWQTLQMLEDIARAEVRKAERIVAAESREHAGEYAAFERALDEISLESVDNVMLFGRSKDSPGPLARIVERAASSAGTFAKVDPQKWIVTAIRRDAKAEVRRHIGDPHIGPKVRALALELGTRDLEVLLPVYNRRYPADTLSDTRAQAALELWDRPSASTFEVLDADAPLESFEDSLVERLDAEARLRRSRMRLVPTGAPAGAVPAGAGTRRSQQAAARSLRRRSQVAKNTSETGRSRGAS